MKFLVHPQDAVGEYIGEYQILSCLGIGKIGSTYHVRSQKKNREYALKIFRFPQEMSLDLRDRFQAFLSLWGNLHDRYINPLESSGKWEDFFYIVKEFTHNGEGVACNARDFFYKHSEGLSPFQVYNIARQVGEALKYLSQYRDAYRQGLYHGNLTPSNILLAWHQEPKEGRGSPFEVRLTDLDPYQVFSQEIIIDGFGERKQLIGSEPYMERSYEEHVLTAIYESANYRSPELLSGQSPSLSDDFFALGQILYFLATGRNYFGTPPSISSLRSEFSPEWDALIVKLLNPKGVYRFESPDAYLGYLDSHLSDDFKDCKTDQIEDVRDQPIRKAKVGGGLTPIGMVYVPKGVTLIGNEKCGEDALPQHQWESPGFYIDRVPVTNRQFAEFVVETGYVTEVEEEGKAPVWMGSEWKLLKGIHWKDPMGRDVPKDFPEHPVTQVTYKDAQAYAEWLGRRLPTEKEWEFAAKGGLKDVDYPWGWVQGKEFAHYSAEGTIAVMSYPANGYGIYDMAGNVWEWTSSWYDAYPGNLKGNTYFGERFKVVRGGAWLYDGFHCMLAYRNANQISHSYPTLGFRTVVDVPQESEEGPSH